ncbi:MAG: tetratricopeptide repeat protein [Spirochaetota bacterium]
MAGSIIKVTGKVRILILATALSVSVLSLHVACTPLKPHISVFLGNAAFNKGDYQKANIYYLTAGEEGVYADYISYNLGNVYFALGEPESAEEAWKRAATIGRKELQPDVTFNIGVLYYEVGEYEKASEAFKNVLERNPSSLDAKINLEYSLQKINAKGTSGAVIETGDAVDKELKDDYSNRILEYVRRKELRKWESPREITPEVLQEDW